MRKFNLSNLKNILNKMMKFKLNNNKKIRKNLIFLIFNKIDLETLFLINKKKHYFIGKKYIHKKIKIIII